MRAAFVAFFALLLVGDESVASGHRDAPHTALDPAADVADVFAFRSSTPDARVTLIMTVNPFLEPGGGALGAPFDPTVLYEIQIDNDNDAIADVRFQFRFTTELRLADGPIGILGAGSGINAPANSPPPVAPGTLVVPPQIDSFGDPGLGVRQSYTVTLVRGSRRKTVTPLGNGAPLFAVPDHLGPRTMSYDALFNAAIYDLGNGVRVFAGTTDDPFFADVAGLSDTLNLRSAVNGGVLSAAQDAALQNFASDTLSGYAVNAIAIEVPVEMLTLFGTLEPPTSATATIGVWATASRFATERHPPPKKLPKNPRFKQVDRMGNPFVSDWLIGLASKDAFDYAPPAKDSDFEAFFTDPRLARTLNAATGGAIAIPPPPRSDLAFLFGYAPPVAPAGNVFLGPTADLLHLNVGTPPTAPGSESRLGIVGGDQAGFPNGRRLFDDVTDVMLRVVGGGVFAPGFDVAPNNRLGDGVNVNDAPFRTAFPYLANAPSGRDRRHIDPGEAGCTAGSGAACPP
ncbi:MAG TPA: DUF4331 domain-containing protein [Candidatus Binatia bacterium]|nr:DUF4331 domain-containing protein [Candidatus Binatia bacterium]